MALFDWLEFDSPEEREKKRKKQIYEIGEATGRFFEDDAPGKFGFEEREGQQDMAFEILDAIKSEQHIAVEAGVGIGKSFAYLVPLMLYNQRSKKPVVIATSTIALQEQLLDDAHRLQKLLHLSQEITLAKGQSHYLCLKRAEEYISNENAKLRHEIEDGMRTGYFERKNYPFAIPQAIWDGINVTRYSKRTCDACPQKCAYRALRQRLKFTDGIILCNQDLLTAHLINQSHGQEGVLNREIEIAVIDEANNLEDKVRSATTEHFSKGYLFSRITAAVRELRSEQQSMVREEANDAKAALNAVYDNLTEQLQKQVASSTQDMKYADRFFFDYKPESMELIAAAATRLHALSERVEIYSSFDYRQSSSAAASDELESLSYSMSELSEEIEKRLVWIERKGPNVELLCCPKNTSDIIRQLYFNGSIHTILTSATLTNANTGSVEEMYSYFVNNTGFPLDKTAILSEPKPSPFPYDEHAMIYYCDDLPHPTREHDDFIQQGVARMKEILEISQGKALVLFTAKTDMEEVYAQLQSGDLPYKILMQQPGASQDRILQEFKDDTNSVLLGTGAYWEGISIEGKSLSNLIIFRLPFPVPDPIINYKASVAKDPLMDVQVPEMIIKFKQGIGRLIRNFTDTGIVSIIDSRLRDNPKSRYYDIAWASLPIHNRTTSLTELEEFYHQITTGQG